MAAQQARIADTIVEMKRAQARRDDDSDHEDTIDRSTNRGNKLMHDAKYVQEGRLGNMTGPAIYLRKHVHAGYTRNIIYRNPLRFDEDGDLIVEDEFDDGEGDISPAEDNIYGDIKIEETLAPLTAASDLPRHPGLAPAYYSRAIDEMLINVSQSLRREQSNLVRLKTLLTTLRGDAQFAPCGNMHTDFDDMLLSGRWLGGPGHSRANFSQEASTTRWRGFNGSNENLAAGASIGQTRAQDVDTEMADAEEQGKVNGTEQAMNGPTTVMEAPSSETNNQKIGDEGSNGAVKTTESNGAVEPFEGNAQEGQQDAAQDGQPSANTEEAGAAPEGDDEDSTSQPMSHRMTTRAQANKQSEQSSPTIASAHFNEEEAPPIHPFFLFPTSATPDADFGLPHKEAEDTRTLLSLYVAKQEEVVRCFEDLQNGLLRAKRQRDTVLKWAKAEGHVGEMSDGEDWYDMEEWGLKEPLKKGEEEPDEEANIVGKKTRQRRTEK